MNQPSSAYKLITSYNQNVRVRLYTPAHQGIAQNSERLGEEIYKYDVPFLTRPRTHSVEKHFSQLYGTKHTFWLTGGGTQGVLTACALLNTQYRRVAIALNSHISVINGIILAGLEPYFIPSQYLMPTAEEVILALETSGVSALLLTYPSYEGITIDLAEITDHCRKYDIALVVDEAHGSHFPFLDSRWQSAIAFNADIVIHSLHKYTGSLVQTALFHLPTDSRFTIEQVMGIMPLFETTTRSNLLILSIEDAIKKGHSKEGKALFWRAIQKCDHLRGQLDRYDKVLTYDPQVNDPLKLCLKSEHASGEEIGELLYEGGVDYEYANEKGVLLIFSFQHTEVDFDYVWQVLQQIYHILLQKPVRIKGEKSLSTRTPIMRVLPKEAFFAQREKLPLAQAKGRISCTCFKKVPPGIPILIPGEEITDWHQKNIASDIFIDVIERVESFLIAPLEEKHGEFSS
ncbi:aminotransferase class I/II-fold pyridoxal phosphate-dependent enzyme [uncultured Nostoc sp.]|uniref:aminotransferase class I/II-fold pyridoxal phosphate-dependent enzyme n=1 Tax=uncultured Nostoc sp. TaxID=340711 RepID=UPI0035CC36E5